MGVRFVRDPGQGAVRERSHDLVLYVIFFSLLWFVFTCYSNPYFHFIREAKIA